MGKTLKSVKVDNDLLKIIDMYTALMKSISGGASTFTTMVEEGIILYLLEQIRMLKFLEGESVIIESGILKKLVLTHEQKDKIEELATELISYEDEHHLRGLCVGSEG